MKIEKCEICGTILNGCKCPNCKNGDCYNGQAGG